MKLKDKVAVITGGNSGIGLAIAEEFKAEGAWVAICGLNRVTLDAAQSKLGSDVLVEQADISNLTDLDRFYAAIADRFGKIDVVVANAGASGFMPMEQFDEATFDRLTNVNFKGTFFTVQKALPLLNDGASIILMSANGQSRGLPGATAIAATKAAVRSLARTVSADLAAARGIRANCISPGPIDTPCLIGCCRQTRWPARRNGTGRWCP